jgi:hypothetical protein
MFAIAVKDGAVAEAVQKAQLSVRTQAAFCSFVLIPLVFSALLQVVATLQVPGESHKFVITRDSEGGMQSDENSDSLTCFFAAFSQHVYALTDKPIAVDSRSGCFAVLRVCVCACVNAYARWGSQPFVVVALTRGACLLACLLASQSCRCCSLQTI